MSKSDRRAFALFRSVDAEVLGQDEAFLCSIRELSAVMLLGPLSRM